MRRRRNPKKITGGRLIFNFGRAHNVFQQRRTPRILILGIGNPIRSDDGVGFHVASEVEKRARGVDVKRASLAGLNILDLIVGYDTVILVDAILTNRNVGEIRRLTLKDIPKLGGTSTHDIGLKEAIDLGNSVFKGRMPKKIVLYTVEVDNVLTFSEKLTPKVEAAVPKIVDLIIREIKNIRSTARSKC